jgi:hypothetical protein
MRLGEEEVVRWCHAGVQADGDGAVQVRQLNRGANLDRSPKEEDQRRQGESRRRGARARVEHRMTPICDWRRRSGDRNR